MECVLFANSSHIHKQPNLVSLSCTRRTTKQYPYVQLAGMEVHVAETTMNRRKTKLQ